MEKALFSSPAACLKSINERLKKLENKDTPEAENDICQLQEFKSSLEAITVKDFSRYQELLNLLQNNSEYAWNKKSKEDRIVIFTERIETLRFLAENLRNDLKLSKDAVIELYGGLSDIEQQKIVEDFGRSESKIRVLVASDVASEGLNLHYLCHRVIHFDIPWSLMVFQQRNGRVDRYGQKNNPDIRYMLIEAENERIKGDMRIMEILTEKEEQALKNIGDPALLFGNFSVEEEEEIVAKAIENNGDVEELEKKINSSKKDMDFFDILFSSDNSKTKTSEEVEDKTLYSDCEYLKEAFNYFNQEENQNVKELSSGLEIKLNDEMQHNLEAFIPKETFVEGSYLKVSANKKLCMEQMRESMQKNMDEEAYPNIQFLWKLHPVFSYVNNKAGLLFKRGEAPVIELIDKLEKNELIFIVAGSIPNRKSTPLVDEWFGVQYKNGKFVKILDMIEVLKQAGFKDDLKIPNRGSSDTELTTAISLREDVVKQAKAELARHYQRYQDEVMPQLEEEKRKLAQLKNKHKKVCEDQLQLFEDEKIQRMHLGKHEKEMRRIDDIFGNFEKWVEDTMTIQNNPYIRIISVLKGGEK